VTPAQTLQTAAELADAAPACKAAGLSAPEPAVLGVYSSLFARLTRASVPWCYWKSTRRAGMALAGHSDLDILVAADAQHEARHLLRECGFRRFVPVANRTDPTIECYLSLDEPSGRIAHVDLHTQLRVGGNLLKTHHLPCEAALIARAMPRTGSGLPVLDPASEAVLLVVRACLELRKSDPVALRHWRIMAEKFALDRRELAARVTFAAVQARAGELLGAAAAPLVAAMLFDPLPFHQQRRQRRILRRALLPYRTVGAISGIARTAGRTVSALSGTLNRQLLHWPHPWNRRVAGAGVVIAVVAVDGAGKSTLVRGLRKWLGDEVDVLPLYFGTGDGRPSWFLLPFKLLVPLASKLVQGKPKGSSHGAVSNAPAGVAYSVLLTLWASMLAMEKRLKLGAARRAAARGMVVLTDRYPQDELADFNDGPLLPRLRGVPRWLRGFEASAYALAAKRRPDLVIKLLASPELIAAREPNMDQGVIRARVAGVDQLRFGGAQIATIAAGLPAAEVLLTAKRQIWRLLRGD